MSQQRPPSSGLFDDIVGPPPPSSGLFDDIIAKPSKPKVPKGYAAPKPTQVGAMAGVTAGVAGKPYQKTFTPDQERRFKEVEAGKVKPQKTPPVEQRGSMQADVFNRFRTKLGESWNKSLPTLEGEPDTLMGLPGEEKLTNKGELTKVPLGTLAADIATLPVNLGIEVGTILDPGTTATQKGGALFNIASTLLGPAEVGAALKGTTGATKNLILKVRQKFGDKAAKAVEEQMLEWRSRPIGDIQAEFRPKTEVPPPKTPEAPKPALAKPVAPKTAKPEAEAPVAKPEPEVTGVTGLARRFRDPEQIAAGKEVTPPVPRSAEALADTGRKLYESGKAKPKDILDKIADPKYRPSHDVDVPVIQHYKAVVRDEKQVLINARKKAKPEDKLEIDFGIAKLDQESDRIEAFSQRAATEFHGMGEALQIAHNESMDFVDIREQARALNLGENLHPKTEKQLEGLTQKYADALSEIEFLKSKIDIQKIAPARGSLSHRRASALGRLKNLGIEVAAYSEPRTTMRSKQSGAVKFPEFGTTNPQIRSAINDLSGVYIKEGAKDLDAVLRRLSNDVPGMAREDFLSALSPAIRKYRTEAMVAAGETRKVMSKIRTAAEFRQKSLAGKGLSILADLGKNFKRNVQASFDLSAAMLQGKPALLARPGSWLKSWESVAKVLSPVEKRLESGEEGLRSVIGYQGADRAAQKMYANLLQEPTIKEAVEQGWWKPRSPHGTFSPQEEIFRGEIAHVVPGIARSDAAFGSQLNAMYGDWYRKLAAIMPDNAHYKQSIGAIMNMLSGRGHGQFADVALSHPGMGWLSFAPRYAYSLAQVGTGAPIWFKGLHPRARMEAAKIYASGIATVYLVNKAAPLFGFSVDNDPRSVNFGMLEKDGKMVDGYNKLTAFPRMLIQLFYGKEGGRGQFKEPGDYNFEPLVDYLHGNFSPALRDLEMISTGKVWDQGEGKMRDATNNDIYWSYAPLGIQDIRKMKDPDLATILLGVMGGRPRDKDTSGLKKGEKPKPPFDIKPPGIKRIEEATAKAKQGEP